MASGGLHARSHATLLTTVAWLLAMPVGFWLMNAGYAALGAFTNGSRAVAWTEIPMAWNYLAASVLLVVANSFLHSRGLRLSLLAGVSAVYLALFSWQAFVYLAVAAPVLWLAIGREDMPGRAASLRFWCALAVFFLAGPKLYAWVPALHWLPRVEIFFQGVFLRYCYLYYERRKGIVPATGLHEHLAYLLFIPQVHGILNFPQSVVREPGHSRRLLVMTAQSFLLATLKITCLFALDRFVLADFGFRLGVTHIATLDRSGLWWALLANYVAWFLQLSASFDLMTGAIRMFGVPVENNFRWALLAASPIELWRRWNIYNRKLLLKFIYFPLGGARRHLYRNVLATFLASALLLHSGWFGGPWLYPNSERLLDECLYFLLQGLLVCAALAARHMWNRTLLRCREGLALKNHILRRETPREAGWDKAGEELWQDCMGSYCPNRNSSPTQSRPASRKSQQIACDFSGLAAVPGNSDSDPFSRPSSLHPLRRLIEARPALLCWRLSGIAFTLCASAWCHAITLMSGHKIAFDTAAAASLPDRLALMARALGLPVS